MVDSSLISTFLTLPFCFECQSVVVVSINCRVIYSSLNNTGIMQKFVQLNFFPLDASRRCVLSFVCYREPFSTIILLNTKDLYRNSNGNTINIQFQEFGDVNCIHFTISLPIVVSYGKQLSVRSLHNLKIIPTST